MQVALLIFVLLLAFNTTQAQVNTRDSSIRIVSINAEFGLQYPFADMSRRFGYGGIAGVGMGIKTKSNWILGMDYHFIFGSIVREDTILNGIMTKSGYILNNNAEPVQVNIFERGFMSGIQMGRLFSFVGPNPNSGLSATLGMGLMQHRIRIVNQFVNVPQLSGAYRKGYDRLSNGIYLSQSIGYHHTGNSNLVNYFVGIQVFEGFTENRRTVNYDTGVHDGSQRLDVVATIVARWYIPLYKKRAKDFYFY